MPQPVIIELRLQTLRRKWLKAQRTITCQRRRSDAEDTEHVAGLREAQTAQSPALGGELPSKHSFAACRARKADRVLQDRSYSTNLLVTNIL